MVPFKLLLIKTNWDTEEPKQSIPVQMTDPAPQGYEVAVPELQSQPVKRPDAGVTAVGMNEVGEAELDSVGDAEGATVGVDGQFVIPS